MSNKFRKYTSKFLYASNVRGMLGRTPVGASDMSNEIISVGNNFTWCIDYSERGAWFDENKAEFFAYALALGYIPFGDAGREYVKNKLGLSSLFEYQYETAINVLKLDNAFITLKEESEIWNMFRLAEQRVAKYDLVGIVNIVYSCYFTYGFGKYSDKYEELIQRLKDGEESVELPDVQCTELDVKKIEILDHLIKIRADVPSVYEILLAKEDYSAVAHKEFNSFLATNTEKDCKTGDVLKFRWEHLALDAKVLDVPNTDEGKYIVFEVANRANKTEEQYKAPFNKEKLQDIEIGDEFILVLKDEKLWENLYMYETIVLTDESGIAEMTVFSGQNYTTKVHTRQELLEKLDTELPVSEDIDTLTEQDFKYGIVLLKVERED